MPKIIQKRALETRNVILKATSKELVRLGYSGTTTNHVAEAAGVSIGSLYRYFKNKEELVSALIQEETKAAESLLLQALAEKTELEISNANLIELTQKVVRTIFDFYCERYDLWRVFYHELARGGKKSGEFQILDSHFAQSARVIELYLNEFGDSVLVRNKSLASKMIVYSVIGAFFGTTQNVQNKLEREQLFNEIFDIVALYLFAPRLKMTGLKTKHAR